MIRFAAGVVFYLIIYLAFVRKRHVQVLHPRYWLSAVRSFRPNRSFLKALAVLSCVLAVFYLAIPLVNEVAEVAMEMPSVEPSSANPSTVLASISPILLLAVGTTLAIIEEWFFRFVIIDSTRKKLGVVGSLIFSSVMFSLAHIFNSGSNPPMFAVPLFAGLILGAVYLKWGLKGSIFLHSGNNFLRTFLWMVG